MHAWSSSSERWPEIPTELALRFGNRSKVNGGLVGGSTGFDTALMSRPTRFTSPTSITVGMRTKVEGRAVPTNVPTRPCDLHLTGEDNLERAGLRGVREHLVGIHHFLEPEVMGGEARRVDLMGRH